mmetsp:Transcript_14395/g.18862  ORF Transcript_14395/g.18862 Transcript_14395/m.18862 type:complete len:1711 (-) Transcript_14395:175-5307(-)
MGGNSSKKIHVEFDFPEDIESDTGSQQEKPNPRRASIRGHSVPYAGSSMLTIFEDFGLQVEGFLEPTELDRAAKMLGFDLSSADRNELIRRMDANQDGKVSLQEFVEFFTPAVGFASLMRADAKSPYMYPASQRTFRVFELFPEIMEQDAQTLPSEDDCEDDVTLTDETVLEDMVSMNLTSSSEKALSNSKGQEQSIMMSQSAKQIFSADDGILTDLQRPRLPITKDDDVPTVEAERPPGKPEEWTPAQCIQWLNSVPGLSSYAEAPIFKENRIDGEKLTTLSRPDLESADFYPPSKVGLKGYFPTALWAHLRMLNKTPRYLPGQSILDTGGGEMCRIKDFLGKNEFGEIYKVEWTGIGPERSTERILKTIRMKDIPPLRRDELLLTLMEEVCTAFRIRPHPYVINVVYAYILNFYSENEEYLCFTDCHTGYTLEEAILGGKGRLYSGSEREINERILRYSLQIAIGLEHIHNCQVVFQDLKPSSILIDTDDVAQFADFSMCSIGRHTAFQVAEDSFLQGLSPMKSSANNQGVSNSGLLHSKLKGFTQCYRSLDIKRILDQRRGGMTKLERERLLWKLTHKSDMWSFGLILLEMYAGGVKWSCGENAPEILDSFVKGHNQPRIPIPEKVAQLLGLLFQEHLSARPPTMESVVAELKNTYRSVVNRQFVELDPHIEDKITNWGRLGYLHMWLGGALYRKGRRAQALREYEHGIDVLSKFPKKDEVPTATMGHYRHMLGRLYLDLDKVPQAVVHLARCVEIVPSNATYRETFAEALLEDGRKDEAVGQLEVAMQMNPANPNYPKKIADLQIQLRQFGRALMVLKEATGLNPGDTDIKNQILYISNLATMHFDAINPPTEQALLSLHTDKFTGEGRGEFARGDELRRADYQGVSFTVLSYEGARPTDFCQEWGEMYTVQGGVADEMMTLSYIPFKLTPMEDAYTRGYVLHRESDRPAGRPICPPWTKNRRVEIFCTQMDFSVASTIREEGAGAVMNQECSKAPHDQRIPVKGQGSTPPQVSPLAKEKDPERTGHEEQVDPEEGIHPQVTPLKIGSPTVPPEMASPLSLAPSPASLVSPSISYETQGGSLLTRKSSFSRRESISGLHMMEACEIMRETLGNVGIEMDYMDPTQYAKLFASPVSPAGSAFSERSGRSARSSFSKYPEAFSPSAKVPRRLATTERSESSSENMSAYSEKPAQQPEEQTSRTEVVARKHAKNREKAQRKRLSYEEERATKLMHAMTIAAIIGQHHNLLSLRYFLGGKVDLMAITDRPPTEAKTLRELMQGPLYYVKREHEEDPYDKLAVLTRMLRISTQLAEVIEYIHSKGVVLNSLTPDDIFVSPYNWHVYLRPNWIWSCWVTKNQAYGQKGDAPSSSEPLVAEYKGGLPLNYQSPEVADYSLNEGLSRGKVKLKLTPASTDMWAWALITLEMFSCGAQPWKLGSGQDALKGLKGYLKRPTAQNMSRQDLMSWLRETECFSEDMEAELKAVPNLQGDSLLPAANQRGVTQCLGLVSVKVTGQFWKAISTQLCRWEIPSGLEEILKRCFKRKVAERYTHMSELVDNIRAVSDTPPLSMEVEKSYEELSEMAISVMNVGVHHRRFGMDKEAEFYYNVALKLDDFPEVHWNLARYYFSSAETRIHPENFLVAEKHFQALADAYGSDDARYASIVTMIKECKRKGRLYAPQSNEAAGQIIEENRKRVQELKRSSSKKSFV